MHQIFQSLENHPSLLINYKKTFHHMNSKRWEIYSVDIFTQYYVKKSRKKSQIKKLFNFFQKKSKISIKSPNLSGLNKLRRYHVDTGPVKVSCNLVNRYRRRSRKSGHYFSTDIFPSLEETGIRYPCVAKGNLKSNLTFSL